MHLRVPTSLYSFAFILLSTNLFSLSMVMADGNEEEKSRLAIEIHSLSTQAIACADNHRIDRKRKKSPFIDWYLVLRVNESVAVDGIKKQYHKLALLLHPDKNKHSKAESAFKIVSEAYFCLSDNARRAVFDSQRKIFSCSECNSSIRIRRNTKIQSPHQQTLRSYQTRRRITEIQDKLKEEALIIIEKCLVANASEKRRDYVHANRTRTETPVFNPLDYKHKSYPQNRSISHRKLEDLRAAFTIGNRYMQSTAKRSSPIFQHQTDRSCFMPRCTS